MNNRIEKYSGIKNNKNQIEILFKIKFLISESFLKLKFRSFLVLEMFNLYALVKCFVKICLTRLIGLDYKTTAERGC